MSENPSGAPTGPYLDRDKCVGHGRCYALAPDTFEPDDDGFGVLLEAGNHDDIETAARNCPERAISF